LIHPYPEPAAGLEALGGLLASLPPFAVAFSGGVDSSLVCAVAQTAARERFAALTADSPFTIRADLERARRLASMLGFRHEVVSLDPLADPALRGNPRNRCYLCKRMILASLSSVAASRGMQVLLDGSGADDLVGDRPGLQAVRELGVRSPLAELGIGRALVVAMSEALGLPEPSRPNNACLATRIPFGCELEPGLLARIDRTETAIRARGFCLVRVRTDGSSARVELGADELASSAHADAAFIEAVLAAEGLHLSEIRAYG
jgi:pyridinium-3,5-biscarboxylic acid mononucleotide sulfurtransferase